jgi:hypothetical protein
LRSPCRWVFLFFNSAWILFSFFVSFILLISRVAYDGAYPAQVDAAYQAKLAYKNQKIEAKKVKKVAKTEAKAQKKMQKYASVPMQQPGGLVQPGSDDAMRGLGDQPVKAPYDPNAAATATAYQQYQMSKVEQKKTKISNKMEQKQYKQQQKYAEKASKKVFKAQQKAGMMQAQPMAHYTTQPMSQQPASAPGAVPFGAPAMDHPVSM